MMISRWLVVLAVGCFCVVARGASGVTDGVNGITGTNAPTPAPIVPKSMPSYEITADCVSPNGKYGVMHERREAFDNGAVDDLKNYLVALAPFKILGRLADEGYVEGVAHAGLDVQWTKDNSTVLVVYDRKWGPGSLLVVQLHGGKVVRQTDLLPGLNDMMGAYFRKSSPALYKSAAGFFTIVEDGSTWTLDSDGLQATCAATTDLKDEGGSWNGAFKAFWDIKTRKWGPVTPVAWDPNAAPQ